MSFLRKDKSKSNIKSLNTSTAGQLPVQTNGPSGGSTGPSDQDEMNSNFGENPSVGVEKDEKGARVEKGRGGSVVSNFGEDTKGKQEDSGSKGVSPTSSSTSSLNQVESKLPFQEDGQEQDEKTQLNSSRLGQGQSGVQRTPESGRSTGTSANTEVSYSPRSSIVSIPQGSVPQGNTEHENFFSELKDNYKGFHANRRPKGVGNTPPLSHPVKPKFKKSGSLLGKLIHSTKKDFDSAHSSNENEGEEASAGEHSRHGSTASSNKTPGLTLLTSQGASAPQSHSSSRKPSSHSYSKKFRIPSISLDYHHGHHHESGKAAEEEEPKNSEPSKEDTTNCTKLPTSFDLDMDLNEMQGIIKSPNQVAAAPKEDVILVEEENDGGPYRLNLADNENALPKDDKTGATLKDSFSNLGVPNNFGAIEEKSGGGWKAPDSWDVKLNAESKHELILVDSESDSDSDESNSGDEFKESPSGGKTLKSGKSMSTTGLLSGVTTIDGEHKQKLQDYQKVEEDRTLPSSPKSYLPVLYGSRGGLSHVIPSQVKDQKQVKGPNYIIRVFKEDNTFTTILCPLETTTLELLNIVQRKFFLDSTTNYQISVYIGNCVKVLEPFEKPLKIQLGLLLLSGYTDNDNLKIIGREDLSFLCKFVVENIYLRGLTHEEESVLSKDYVDVNISKLGLKNIPIIFHQHTYEIEKLNVADNPSIHIPLDFIQSCTNLTSIVFSGNGCSKFPVNILEARKLTVLDLEKNFLDDIPSKISHLKSLVNLKLNSNQLMTLPKSFGKLQSLTSLNLSSNYFSKYPEAVSELINLTSLDLSYNDLSTLPASMGKLKKLTKLNLCTNKLSGNLPPFFSGLEALKRLDIRYNKISNIDVLGCLANLEVAYASKNNISTFNDKVQSLRLLHFDRNPITNLKFENLLPKLTVLDLTKAKIAAIPSEFISKISNIEKLVLDKNHLVNLPDKFGNLSKLAYLSVYSNNLQVLPSTIGKLKALQYLDLHSNNLQTLPSEIWNLKSLSFLNVSSNTLISFPEPPVGVAKRISSSENFKNLISSPASNKVIEETPKISRSASDDTQTETDSTQYESSSSSTKFLNTSSSLADSLLILTLADNRLNDECFETISFLVELKSLNLSYNDLLDFPEGAARRMGKLTELYLSGNELTSLPTDEIENFKALKLLYLNNNKLSSLPAELSKLINLQHLDVGSNQLKYNVSNWPYDWNWFRNQNLKYLNFSGNKRFEIKQSHIKNPDTNEDLDSLLVLKNLRVLGLIDVTLTTPSVPDYGKNLRIRTAASELDNIGYGVSDTMGMRDFVSMRDMFIQKFRGNENEVLIVSLDGKCGTSNQGHRISSIVKNTFVTKFASELNRIKDDDPVQDAIRRTFLSLNKEINGVLSSEKGQIPLSGPQENSELAELNISEDGHTGCSASIIYLKDKKLYSANTGDIEVLLSRNNGDHVLLTKKHDPTNRSEFERIRASGGYVSGDGALDGELPVSRGIGFFNYLPHTHSGPDIKEIDITSADDVIIMASKVLWDYISFESAVDIVIREKGEPMIAAQKLRDFAICYGATDKIVVIVVTLGEKKSNKLKFSSNGLYNNLGRQNDVFASKKRRDRNQSSTGDTTIRRLDEEIEPPEGELALVFTDIKNSTLLWDTYPVAMRSAIKIHNKVMRRQLRIVGGYEVKTEGDAFMVSFPSPTSALLWCFNVQQQLLKEDWPSEILQTDQCCEITDANDQVIFRGLSVRMGIHWGSPVCELDYVTRRMDYFGPMVNRASRISTIADGGQITVSADFLVEIRALFKIHEDIVSKKTTLSDAYQGNIRTGEIIDREILSIEEAGISYFELGEKKLKGLETPELVTLVFPNKLVKRFEIFQQRQNSHDEASNRQGALSAIPVDKVYGLRDISLKLENLCSIINGVTIRSNTFKDHSSEALSLRDDLFLKENEVLGFFNHVVTRIENCIATLQLRQQMSLLAGGDGRINFTDEKPLTDVLEDLNQLVSSCMSRGDSVKAIKTFLYSSKE